METIVQVLDSAVRLSVPLIFAALAGLYSERSGVVDIGLEGKMLIGAFAAAAVASLGAPDWLPAGLAHWFGLLAAMGAATVLALVHGVASITFRGNQIVSGVALNFIASGLTILLGAAWFGQGGRTPPLPAGGRFPTLTLPFAEDVADVPVLGPIYSELISGHHVFIYLAFVAVPFTWWVLFRTRFGLRLRAVGENPAAVDTAGISVAWLRYRAVLCTGVLTGMAGASLSIAQSAGFTREMTAGKGYIALAALIFAKWRPVPVLFTCLLFGLLDAASIRLENFEFPGIGTVPAQVFQALPYVLTVILLAGFIGRAVPPRAAGVPYAKER